MTEHESRAERAKPGNNHNRLLTGEVCPRLKKLSKELRGVMRYCLFSHPPTLQRINFKTDGQTKGKGMLWSVSDVFRSNGSSETEPWHFTIVWQSWWPPELSRLLETKAPWKQAQVVVDRCFPRSRGSQKRNQYFKSIVSQS